MYINKFSSGCKYYCQLIIFVSSCCGWVQLAYATAWVDFAQSTQSVGVYTEDPNDAAVILKKSATCPKNGYLLATGTGTFNGYPSTTVFSYSLTTDNTAPFALDTNHIGTIMLPDTPQNGIYILPFSIQRVDSCRSGQTISYRLVGSVSRGFVGDNYVYTPTLVLQFFDVLI